MDPSWASIPEILRFVRAYLNPEAARKHAAGQLVPLLRFYSSGEQWTKTPGTLEIIGDYIYTSLNWGLWYPIIGIPDLNSQEISMESKLMVLFVAQGVEVERVEWFEAEDEALNKEMYLTGNHHV